MLAEKQIEIDSIKVNYRFSGESNAKKKILILHGWNQVGSKSWEKVISLLASQGYYVVAMDMPGFGDISSFPNGVWSVSDYSNFVAKFVKSIALEDFYLLGHSFGGAVAASLAASHKNLSIYKLFLVAAAIIRSKKTRRQLFTEKLSKIFAFLKYIPGLKKIVYKFIASKDYEKSNGLMREVYHKIIRQDLTNILPNIKLKTILVWGDKDKMTPLGDGLIINEKLPESEIRILHGINHGIHLYAPEILVEIIKKS